MQEVHVVWKTETFKNAVLGYMQDNAISEAEFKAGYKYRGKWIEVFRVPGEFYRDLLKQFRPGIHFRFIKRTRIGAKPLVSDALRRGTVTRGMPRTIRPVRPKRDHP